MDSNQNLFSLTVDPVTKAHLYETAKWARFLAIVGFVFLGLMVVGGIFVSFMLSASMGSMGNEFDAPSPMGSVFTGGMIFFYIVMAALMFFPLLYLYRFAARVKFSIEGNDQETLNSSFHQLKMCFRYVGIFTIVLLGFYALIFIFAMLAGAFFS
jgi:uncharacterized membrane protein YjgN (DUF898 family)